MEAIRNHLVQHHAEREKVRTSVQFLCTRLFGRHISNSTEGRTGACKRVGRDRVCQYGLGLATIRRWHFVWYGFCEPEIKNLRLPASGHEYIGRFDVAVNDSVGVCCFQPISDLDRQLQSDSNGQRLPTDTRCQRLAFQNSITRNGSPSFSPTSAFKRQ